MDIKETYVKVSMDVITFASEDVIVTSNTTDENEWVKEPP